jgi:hypothetical protein
LGYFGAFDPGNDGPPEGSWDRWYFGVFRLRRRRRLITRAWRKCCSKHGRLRIDDILIP